MDFSYGPKIPTDWPIMIIIRYPTSLKQTARNSLVKNFPIHGLYQGAICGVGDEVQVLEGTTSREWSFAVLTFENKKSAQMWYDCTPDIKQPDWLSGVDMIAVPLRTIKASCKPYLQLLEINFINRKSFDDHYLPEVTKYMENKGADVAVVSTEKVVRLRGQWEPNFIVINQFDSQEDFGKAYFSEEYTPIKEKRQTTADATVVATQLTHLFRKL